MKTANDPMPSRWRRFLCAVFGHRWITAGIPGLLEFPCCARCGKWDRYRR